MFSITYEIRNPLCNPLVWLTRCECQSNDLGMRLRHLIRDHITVEVHCGADVAMPHKFLLHSDWRSHRVQP